MFDLSMVPANVEYFGLPEPNLELYQATSLIYFFLSFELFVSFTRPIDNPWHCPFTQVEAELAKLLCLRGALLESNINFFLIMNYF